MRQRYQRGCLRCARRKAGPDRWEFLWRETDETGKRVRRTAIIGTVEHYPTRDLAQAAANGLRMQVNEDRLRQLERRSHALDQIAFAIFSLHQSAASRLSRQVRGWSQAGVPDRPTELPWKFGSPRAAQNLRCLATTTLPKRLGGLRETSLRWPPVCAPVSGPLHPSRGHLQPSSGLVYGGEGHLPLAGLRS